MALKIKHKDIEFGVGDKIRVVQKFQEGGPKAGGAGKSRTSYFEGTVIAIRGRAENKSFTVRRIGEGKIGIERIFPLAVPNIESIKVIKSSTAGVRHAKLYYIRGKSTAEIEKIYNRASRRKKEGI